MELLERYLQAIGKYLREDTKADVLNELRANLLDEMDARADELARRLTEADAAQILRAYGRPEEVALRYLPQRSVIGPSIFPFYTLTLTRVLPLVVYVTTLAHGINFVASHETWSQGLSNFASGLVTSLLLSAAIITAVFAGIGWAHDHGKLNARRKDWDPTKLPAMKKHATDAPTVKRTVKRVLDLALHCFWMAYVIWAPWHPFWLIGPGVFYMHSVSVQLGPAWHTFYLLLIVLLTVQLAVKVVAFLPAVQRFEKPMDLLTRLLAIVALGSLAVQQVLLVPAGPAADLQHIAGMNHGVVLAFRVLAVLIAVGLVVDVWKYAKGERLLRQFAF